MQKEIICCRWAPPLGSLESSAELVWGTKDYNEKTDKDLPCVFFGIYGIPDFYSLWRHRGKRWCFWAGSDIRHLLNGYWLEDSAFGAKLDPRPLANWINKHCESWVENRVEQEALATVGIESKICPSFLGDVKKFDVSYKWSPRPKIYASISGDDFELYRWRSIENVAANTPWADFYLYGNTEPWITENKNVFVRGRVSKEIMNKEIKTMQAAIRPLPFEGCSELVVKAALMGQYVISAIDYPYTTKRVKIGKKPNLKCREWFLKNLNRFPWNVRH